MPETRIEAMQGEKLEAIDSDRFIKLISTGPVNIYVGQGAANDRELVHIVQKIREAQKAERKDLLDIAALTKMSVNLLKEIDESTTNDAKLLSQILDEVQDKLSPENAALAQSIVERLNSYGKGLNPPPMAHRV